MIKLLKPALQQMMESLACDKRGNRYRVLSETGRTDRALPWAMMKRRSVGGRAAISILIYGIIAIMYWPWNSVTCNRRQQSTRRLYQLMPERGGSCLCSDVTALSAHPLPADSQSVVLLAHYHLLGTGGERAADPCNLLSTQFLVWNIRDCDKTGCTIHAFLRGLKDVASWSFDGSAGIRIFNIL